MSGTEQLPWDKKPVPNWRPEVNSWQWQSLGDGDWEKSGNCPRCNHGITIRKEGSYTAITITDDAVTELLVEAERGPMRTLTDAGEQMFARCDCGEPHTGRPAGISRGCGQWAEIDPPDEA